MIVKISALRQSVVDTLTRFAPQVVSFIFLFFVWASWRRWTNPLVDSGREMDLPRRLLAGELLYRDVHYIYAPLSPYINALLYRVFGIHHDVLLATGLLGAALTVFICYRIARRFLAPHLAAAALLPIFAWCIFRTYGNMIAPYSYAALHGALCALGALLFMLRYAERRDWLNLLAAGALSGFAAITKLEFALPAAAAIIAATIAIHWRDWGTFLLRLGSAGTLGGMIALSVYGWWFQKLGWRILIVDCHLFFTHLPDSLISYNAWRAGTDYPLRSLVGMIGSAAVWAAVASAILLICLSRSRRKGARAQEGGSTAAASLRRNAIWTLIGATILIIAIQFGMRGWDGSPMRAIPFVLLALILREGRRILRGDADQRSIIIFVIATYSLAMLARVVLRVPSGGPYGGFMLPTSFILFFYIFVIELPRLIARWMRDDRQEAPARVFGAGMILLLTLITGGDTAIRYRTKYIATVKVPRAHFLVAQVHDPAYLDALAFLRRNAAPGEAIAVFPEGSDLAFLSDLRMPLRHQIFLPGLMSAEDEQKAISQLSAEPIRYILIANRPTREFGAAIFGRDYYPALGTAIERDYRVATVCGRNNDPNIEIGDREFFIKILERK